MTTLNPEQRDELIDQYCERFVEGCDRKTLEMIVWDHIHEELHSLSDRLLEETVEQVYPDLLD
jgi:hypothetical protein